MKTYAETLAEKQKRNEELWRDRKTGNMTFEQLAAKYKITNVRAQQIYKQVCQYKGV